MEILIILLLIILNGVFAMTEIAIVSSRKSKLKTMAENGDGNARRALDLANNPNRFLSTVQIGITFVGIFAGAYGADTLAKPLGSLISKLPLVGGWGSPLAFFAVVAVITYLSLIIGELVPKRIALANPEKIASFMSKFMQSFSALSFPLVNFLSVSTDWILDKFGIKQTQGIPITEEEVKMLIREGSRIGVFNLAERDIVERTFRLSDKKANMLMTPRKEIKWIDISQDRNNIKKLISRYSFSYFPVCSRGLDKVSGIIRTKELLTRYFIEEKIDLQKLMTKPIFIPESMKVLKVLDLFRKSGIHMALVVDEYGSIQGLLSITDILEAMIGDITTINEFEERTIVKRQDGSFLVDGMVTIDEFKENFRLDKLENEESGLFQTIGGFVTNHIGHIPKTGSHFDAGGLYYEVVDMDANRVDKVLVKKS